MIWFYKSIKRMIWFYKSIKRMIWFWKFPETIVVLEANVGASRSLPTELRNVIEGVWERTR